MTAATPTPADVAAHYDDLDAFYRDVWGEHVHHGLWQRGDETREEAVRALVVLVARAARIEAGSRVCDIGCGYGATARMLATDYGARVTGLTVSPAQYAFAQSRANGDNPDYLLGDWLASDLPTTSFDAAVAIESSEHMSDLTVFFAQARRVLRPGGRLVVCAWLSADAPTQRQRRWLLDPICREGRMARMSTAAEYHHVASASGFAAEEMQDVTTAVAPTWPAIVRTFLARIATRPAYLRFLLDRHARNRVFALTIFRLLIAYRTGAMRYGVFTFVADAKSFATAARGE